MSDTRNTIKADPVIRIIDEEIRNVLTALAFELAGTMQRMIRDKGSIATGLLVGSVVPIFSPPADGFHRVMVGTPVEYGSYVEFGTKPHWAPIEPIRRWVEMKIQPHVLSIGVKFEEGRAIPTRKGSKILRGDRRERMIRSVAYAIQRKIAERGTEGKFFMRDSLEKLGVDYAVFTDRSSGETTYQIDTASFLERQDLDIWERVSMRLGTA